MILSMGLPYVRITQAAPIECMTKAINLMNIRRTPVFVLVSKDTVAPYPLKACSSHPNTQFMLTVHLVLIHRHNSQLL